MNQHLHIHRRFAPLTIEPEVNQLVEQYLRTTTDADPRIEADVLELDPTIVEKMNAHLKNGGSLPITFSSRFTTYNTLQRAD